MNTFDESGFRTQVAAALARIKTILDNTRVPQYPADVPHQYDDKYLLAECLTNTALAALLYSLETIGLNEKHLAKAKEWSSNRSVTLRLKAEEKCKFLRTTVREVESDTSHVTEYTGGFTRKDVVVTKITEHFWMFDAKYELTIFMGTEVDKPLVLQQRSGSLELKTSAKTTPRPETVVRPAIDVNITWLLQNMNDAAKVQFSIDRTKKSCHTPRRNENIASALSFTSSIYHWCADVANYFNSQLFPVHESHGLDLSKINKQNIFVPVVPLFEANPLSKAEVASFALTTPTTSNVMPYSFVNSFLEEQKRSIAETYNDLAKVFPVNDKIITVAESKLLVILGHVKQICQSHSDGVDYIEGMLRKQLIAAIGKEVSPVDFTNYQRFHNRKLFRPDYQPRAFCYAIRRPDHYPEGTLSIEGQLDDGKMADPIYTTVAFRQAARPMQFSLSASTRVSFGGERFVHGWINHQFSGYSGTHLNLVARARQFSTYILLVGRIVTAELFEPKYGIIVENKDEISIPLELETIPTPKEFRDAIESLSPEQQRFAKGFRGMQLASTLFAVCVIQIKPQLEKLLHLPNDSLTKEIQLTQELLSLFMEYQIPSDLLSYNDDENCDVKHKLATVKGYVQKMQQMIRESKEAELEEARRKQALREAEERAKKEAERAKKEAEKLAMRDLLQKKNKERQMEKMETKEYRSRQSAPTNTSITSAMSSTTTASISPSPKMASADRAAPAGAELAMEPMKRQPQSAAAPQLQSLSPSPSPSPSPSQSALPSPPQPQQKQPQSPQQQPQSPQQQQAQQQTSKELQKSTSAAEEELIDYTTIPTTLEKRFEEFDEDSALRPTIINPGNVWKKSYQKALLAEPVTTTLNTNEQDKARNKAFDLLDAITRSGALCVDYASLHVVIAATHCFDNTLMNTVIQDNVNPIEKVERSSLIVASTIHNVPATTMVADQQVERLTLYSPKLIEAAKVEEKLLLERTTEAAVSVSTTH